MDVYQLLPEDYAQHLKGKNCEIVYLITSDVTPQERFSIFKAYDTQKDYTFATPDDELYEGCIQLVAQSIFLENQCIAHNVPYYETAKNRVNVFHKIIESLFAWTML